MHVLPNIECNINLEPELPVNDIDLYIPYLRFLRKGFVYLFTSAKLIFPFWHDLQYIFMKLF